MTAVSDDGWYADPTGRPAPRPPRGVRDWSAERPSLGLALALIGGLVAVLGFTAFDWTSGTSFGELRDAVDLHGAEFSVVTQAYLKVVYLPLLIVTVFVGVLGAVGRLVARLVVGTAGVLSGLGLLAAVGWIESGHVGTDASRGDALPVIAVMVAVGVVAAALGFGAYFDERATLARSLAGTLAGLAVVLHVYAVTDLFDGAPGPSFVAWIPLLGFVLLAVAPVLPYRRILHTA
jgi:hypothetical protein